MNQKTLLVIEDDTNIRDVLKLSLQFEGYQVLTAENGKQGFEVLNQGIMPGLILLDLMMPIMNGWEFVGAIKEHKALKQIPIIIVSAYADRARSIDCHDFILKPLELTHLMQTVKKHYKTNYE